MNQFNPGDIINLHIYVSIRNTQNKTKYFTYEELGKFLQEMTKYYFDGDIAKLLHELELLKSS